MARPPRGKRPTAAPRFFVQSEFAPDWEFCRQFFGEFWEVTIFEKLLLAPVRPVFAAPNGAAVGG
jgi:hypothetical protein